MEIETNVSPDTPPIDFDHLEESIRIRIAIEIFHNLGLLKNKIYFSKYPHNAEALNRDFKIWKELEEIDKLIEEEKE